MLPVGHGRCCGRSPSLFSLQLHTPRGCPPLGPVWRGRCGATSGRPVMAVVAGVPPVFPLSNVSPFELAPRLAPCGGLAVAQPRAGPSWPLLPAFPQLYLSQTSLPLSLPPAWPRVAGSLWRNLGVAGPSWPLLPAFPQIVLSPSSRPLSLSLAWPRVAGSVWRNLGPARHGRCCRRSPSPFTLQLHSP